MRREPSRAWQEASVDEEGPPDSGGQTAGGSAGRLAGEGAAQGAARDLACGCRDGASKGKAQRCLEMALHGEGTQKGFPKYAVSTGKAAEGTPVPAPRGAGDRVTETV